MKKTILYIALLISFLPIMSQAQEYKLLEPLPCIEGTGINCTAGNTIDSINFNDYIAYIFRFAIALSVFLAVVMIIWGGLQYMTSEVPFIKTSGKSKIWDAITGLIMVLASYLILQTIDPRLVEVNTNIPAIQISREDLDSVRAFSDKLSGDLRRLTSEKQLKVIELENQIIELNKQKETVEKKLQGGELITDPDVRNRYENELAKIKGDISKRKTEQAQTIAEGIGTSNFRQAYEAIQKPEQANPDVLKSYTDKPKENILTNGALPVDSPNKIQNDYNKRINEINSAGPNPEITGILAKQRDFYIAQIQEEETLKKNLDLYNVPIIDQTKIYNHGAFQTTDGGRAQNSTAYTELNKKLKTYETEISDTQKIAASGLSETEYKNIMQTRIDKIKKATGSK